MINRVVQGDSKPTRVTTSGNAGTDVSEMATTKLLTANDVLYNNELRRGRLWVSLSGVLAAIGLASAVIIESPGSLARLLLAGGCGALLIVSLVGWRLLRRRQQYSSFEAALFGYFSLAVVLPAYYFFGWFSPVMVVVCLGGIVFAMGHTTRAVYAMAATTSLSHMVVGGLTIAGVLGDVGVASPRIDDTVRAVVVLGGAQWLFLISFILGRQLRAHALDGVERYGDAVRESTRREVLLQEAIDELHHARRIGGRGRFTGVELGAFRLGVVLGRGGMGEVYEASHVSSNQSAAVKVLTHDTGGERAARRFQREIAVVATLDSPHIVRVLGHSAPDDAMPYLVMERLRGATLAESLRQRLDELATLQMLREVAEAVDAAHEAGVIHRDLKPQNIFHHVGEGQDVWKVLDFGLSKLIGAGSSLTGMGVVGTPRYMSPEQAGGREITVRSDLFALGCVAYRCLTGRPAFTGTEMAEVLLQIASEMPVRPSAVAVLPVEVDMVLAIALAKQPGDRFASAFDFSVALTEACKANIKTSLAARAEALTQRAPWTQASR